MQNVLNLNSDQSRHYEFRDFISGLGSPETTETANGDGDEPPPPPSSTDVAVNYCRHPTQPPRQDAPAGASLYWANLQGLFE
jgi:hypothetical protein